MSKEEILKFDTDGKVEMKFRKDDYYNFLEELKALASKYDFGINENSVDIYIKKLDFYDIVYDEEENKDVHK